MDEEINSGDLANDPDLVLIKADPINLNHASKSELQLLPWLSENQIQKIILSRRDKPLKNKADLIKLGINEMILEDLEDYIVFDHRPELRFKNTIRGELNRSRLKQNSSLKLYSKSMMRWEDLEVGFISDKDQGESNILDFYSYYLHWQQQGWLKQLIIGKFQVYTGLGILLNSKLGGSRNIAYAGNILRLRTTIRPYKSAYENWALQGLSAELQFSNMKLLPVYSKASLSANLESGKITSFNETGLNYDPQKKNNVKETIYGLFTVYESDQYTFNLGILHQEFDHQFSDSLLSNRIRSINLSFEFWKQFLPLNGEIAWSDNQFAAIFGLAYRTDKLRQQLIYRRYDKYFPDWHGNAFAASSSFPNEEGLYYGFTFTPLKTLKINFYFDMWKIPETAYFEKMPTAGNELMFCCILKIPDKNLIKYQFKLKNREKYINLEESKIHDLQQIRTRLTWEKQMGRIKLSSRLDYAEDYVPLDKKLKQGFLFSQLIKYQDKRVKLVLQLASFAADLSQYLYEYSVDGAMNNNVLSGNDISFNLLLSYIPVQHLKLQTSVNSWLQKNAKQKLVFQIVTEF